MKEWIASQLGESLMRTSGRIMLLDPDDVLDAEALAALAERFEVIRAVDWAALRSAWDSQVRRRKADEPPVVVCVSSPEFVATTDLPWDVEHEADEMIRLRWPFPAELRRALLRVTDDVQLPDLNDWIEAAKSWGRIRASLATSPDVPDSAEAAWRIWDDLDDRFREWLRRSYGSSLQSAKPFAALHKVAPQLTRRVEDGANVLLIVIDGLGFAQWHPLHRAAGFTVMEVTGSLAMIPTLTSVSRQAIFAGELPRYFAEHISTTRAEERRWRQFWKDRGLADREVFYAKTLGGESDPIPEPHGRAAAVVINAVDDILHGAEVLGDRQVAAAVGLWARSGFLTDLVSAATRSGYETWITSDHGNLLTRPRPAPREGQVVEQAGTRVRIYPNAALRQQAAEHGEVWDPPGLPTDSAGYYPLFAPGRYGYHSIGERVTHGGLSLDEVIVPVARVSA